MNRKPNPSSNSSGSGLADMLLGLGTAAAVGYAAYQVYQSANGKEEVTTSNVASARATSNQSNNAYEDFLDELTGNSPSDWLKVDLKNATLIAEPEDWNVHQGEVKKFMREARSIRAVGLDVEWMSDEGPHAPGCLLQLGTLGGRCLLIRLNNSRNMKQEIKSFLEDSSYIKAGLGMKDDVRRVMTAVGVNITGWVDLDNLDYTPGRSLQEMAQDELEVTLKKNKTYNWNVASYSEPQILYAARDANVSFRLLIKFVSRRESMEPSVFEDQLQAARKAIVRACQPHFGKPADRRRMLLNDN